MKLKLCLTWLLLGVMLLYAIFPSHAAAETSADERAPMKCGVLAHEMNETQAQTLAANRIYVEADVNLNPDNEWQTIYSLSKHYNLSLIGKLLHVTVNGNLNPDLQVWNKTVQEAVNRYGDIVRIWEIWNEPTDKTNFFTGTAADYTNMLQVAYQIIKAHSNESTVIGFGGLHLYSGGDLHAVNGLAFAQEVVNLGGMSYCDAIGLHAYPWGNNSYWFPAFSFMLAQYRAITGDKEVWITEIGQESYRSGEFNQAVQAEYLTQSFNLLYSQNVSAYIWYELNDKAERIERGETTTFGLYDQNTQPKIALQTFTDLANSIEPIPETPSFTILAPIIALSCVVILKAGKHLNQKQTRF